jgi:hypothetical protein
MRKTIALAILFFDLTSAALTISAQQRATPAAPAAPAYRAPRSADNRPNLSGTWQALNEGNWNIEPHPADFGTVPGLGAINAVPPGPGIVEGGPIPYRPEALARRNENYKNRGGTDPEAKCYPPGVPRAMYMPYPFEIVQNTDYMTMLFQYAAATRTVYIKEHKPAPAPSAMGQSNGRWEGETLVIETTGLEERTWFDRAGNFHSDQMKVTERITARSADTLNYEATIDDPKTFTRIWKISFPLYRRFDKQAQIVEFKCTGFVEGR